MKVNFLNCNYFCKKFLCSIDIFVIFRDYMDRFDDQESPAPITNRERSASPVTCLLYNDPKRNSVKSSSENDNSNVNSEPKHFDLNSASPTVTSVSPDIKTRSSSPKNVPPSVNGVHEDNSLEPPVNKKLKTDVAHYGIEEGYSDTIQLEDKSSFTPAPHITDSINSSCTVSESVVS